VAGALLVATAPLVSAWTFAYYGVGMILSVLCVVVLIIHKLCHALPGSSTVKVGTTAQRSPRHPSHGRPAQIDLLSQDILQREWLQSFYLITPDASSNH
jgi:hypothetical protein